MNISQPSLLPARALHVNGPPPRRLEREPSPEAVTDSIEFAVAHDPRPQLGSVLAKSALLAVGALGAAGAASAQSLPDPPPVAHETVNEVVVNNRWGLSDEPLDLSLNTEDFSRPETDSLKTRVGVGLNSVNDFMPDAWTGWLGRPQHKTPDGRAFDDDGWTAEVQLLANIQTGNTEWVMGARLSTITQTGSRYPYGEDYRGLRTDLGELVVQRNTRVQTGNGGTLDYGFGGGLQAIGNVGGEAMQRGWHELGIVGGRLGDDLQGNQVSDGFRVMPLLTGGIKYSQELSPNLSFVAGGQAALSVGNGLSVMSTKAGLEARRGPLSVEFGAKLEGAHSKAPEFFFHDPNGVHPGWYGRVDFQPAKWGGIYTQLETGGIRNEPLLTFGVRFGVGGRARLSPFW